MLTLVLGGARSGKSRYAQSLCAGKRVVYIATSKADDEEMQHRVDQHRASRPEEWTTVEAPLSPAEAIASAHVEAAVLLDCVTVWVSNLLWEWRHLEPASLQTSVMDSVDGLISAASHREVIVVSNEVGSGVVPEHPVARQFRDLQGLANQRLAAAADRVVLTVAGLPVVLKPEAGGPKPEP